jgi:hypothetical protein
VEHRRGADDEGIRAARAEALAVVDPEIEAKGRTGEAA